MIYCKICRQALPDDSVFCQYCGEQIKVVPAKADTTAQTDTAEAPSQNSKAKTAILILSIVAAGLLCALIAVAAIRNSELTSIKRIGFEKDIYDVTVGDTFELNAMVYPGNAKDFSCYFVSSDEGIVSTEKGKAHANAAGTAVISAYQNQEKYGQCTVVVRDIEPSSVVIDTSSPVIGEIARPLKPPIKFAPRTTTDVECLFFVHDPEIAEVVDGNIVGRAEGTTVIDAIHRGTGITASFEAQFVPVALESFEIDMPTQIAVGEAAPLSVAMTPADATGTNFSWYSSDYCACIEDGKLVARWEGKTTVTATHTSGVTQTLEIEVVPVPVESVSIAGTNRTIEAGSYIDLTASVSPANATDTTITWSSSNASVAKVDNDGRVTGASAGIAYISAASSNGKTGTIMVTVKPKSIPIENSWVVKPNEACICPMKISAPNAESVYVYFKERSSSSKDFGVLVKAGSSYEFDAPAGTYTAYYASGITWYGREGLFGDNTSYVKCNSTITNYTSGNMAYGNELTLYSVYNGNMSSTDIPASQFPG